MRGLYIHVPFCLSKCPYCDFYSERYSHNLAELYTNAVKRNLRAYPEQFDTVYFGGGTPMLLWREIAELLGFTDRSDGCEITVEANPNCITEEMLLTLRAAGANRISFGVQSFCDNELSALGRRHNADCAEKAVLLAKSCGFENISADLMLGTPGQTAESVKQSIERAAALPLTHISAYMLKLEPGTPFGKNAPELPDEDDVCEIYLEAAALLEKNGFIQYEISNFAKTGFESRHNLKYWRCEEYLGIGPAAHSYYGGKRFYVDRDLNGFIESELQKTFPEEGEAGGFDEFAMLRLRLCEGLRFADCERFGASRKVILNRLKAVPAELYEADENRLWLTRNGFLLSNSVISAVLGY